MIDTQKARVKRHFIVFFFLFMGYKISDLIFMEFSNNFVNNS